jgi:hypothetical protein
MPHTISLNRRAREWEQVLTSRRQSLQYRLKHAIDAEREWPSTRATAEVHRIEAELDEIYLRLFVRPGSTPLLSL